MGAQQPECGPVYPEARLACSSMFDMICVSQQIKRGDDGIDL